MDKTKKIYAILSILALGLLWFKNWIAKVNQPSVKIPMAAPDIKETTRGVKNRQTYKQAISHTIDPLKKKQALASFAAFGEPPIEQASPKHHPPEIAPDQPTSSLPDPSRNKVKEKPQSTIDLTSQDDSWFFSYKSTTEDQQPTSGPQEGVPITFYEAFLDEDQKVIDGGPIVLKLKQDCLYKTEWLKKGTLLYGQARFIQNRILADLHVAQSLGRAVPVQLRCYDRDFLLGIFYKGVHPVIKSEANQWLNKLGHLSDNQSIRMAEKAVGEVLKGANRMKSFKLHKGREVYVFVP